ncbi:uncharacterized protein LOC126769623 [Nymphalis io]|uniref:uncharacterized protein LOC126769623 n=1 Tax=Inachis io TaxID=171585 RepID=UPI0021685ED4|nr:uncharacterized protein LOC126769623 [Nymphalis io]
MDGSGNKRTKAYGRVMPRVYNVVGHRSRPNYKSNSNVTRHETSSSLLDGAKPNSSNVCSGSYRELPIVLHDYKPETPNKSRKLKYVAKPKKTLKSLDTAKSPIMNKKLCQISDKVPNLSVRNSAPCVMQPDPVSWSDYHFRQCYSSRSHTRLKDIKDEIEAFQEGQKLMQFRSNLYKKTGVVLDDLGEVAADKAVQVEELDNTTREIRVSRREYLNEVFCSHFLRLASRLQSVYEEKVIAVRMNSQ